MPQPAVRYSSLPMHSDARVLTRTMSSGLSSWPMRLSSASTCAAVTTCPSGILRKSSFTPGRKNQSSGTWSMVIIGLPSIDFDWKWIGASMCVPLWVVSLISSIAQPSPSGRSSSRKPGKSSQSSGAVSALVRYSILGRMNGGSYTVSFSSGEDRSIMRLGSFMIASWLHRLRGRSLRFLLLGLPLARLQSFGEVLVHDVGNLLHDHGMKPRRFFDRGVRQVGIGGQIDIVELALESRTGRDSFAEPVLLKEIHEMKNVLWHRSRFRRIEGDDEFDRNIRPVERIGGIEGRVRAERMANENDDVLLAARIIGGDPRHRRLPA